MCGYSIEYDIVRTKFPDQVLIRSPGPDFASVHEGKKPFTCGTCDDKFSKRQTLKEHITSFHEEKKPFKCKACDYSSSVIRNLKVHVSSIHEGKKSYRCEVCSCKFSKKGA